MIKINGKEIIITGGDTLTTKINMRCKLEDGTYTDFEPEEGDSIQFIVKDDCASEGFIIQKSVPIDTLLLTLTPEETSSLIPRRKPYIYDIKLTTSDGVVDTFIDNGRLFII